MRQGRIVVSLLGVAVAACGAARLAEPDAPVPGLVFPARFSDGTGGETGASPDSSTTPAASPAAQRRLRSGSLPDPSPLRLARQWEYEIAYERGEVRVVRVVPREFAQPVVTARLMGRYAIELWIGRELIDRVRFDFPLLAAEELRQGPRRPLHEPPSFAPGAAVSRTVLVPATDRATRAILVDRATGRETPLPWPPPSPGGSGGPPPAASTAPSAAGSASEAEVGAGGADPGVAP